MKRSLISLALLVMVASAASLWAQQGNTLTIAFAGVPTGSCAFMMQAADTVNGTNYFCNPLTNTWYLAGGGTAPVTPSGTLTLNHMALGAGTSVVKVDSACITDGAGALSGCTSLAVGSALPSDSTTVAGGPVKLSAGNYVSAVAADASTVPVWVNSTTAGEFGAATIRLVTSGQVTVPFDATAVVAGDCVVKSVTVDKKWHDAGATCPVGSQNIGYVVSGGAGSNSYPIQIGESGAAAGGSGVSAFQGTCAGNVGADGTYFPMLGLGGAASGSGGCGQNATSSTGTGAIVTHAGTLQNFCVGVGASGSRASQGSITANVYVMRAGVQTSTGLTITDTFITDYVKCDSTHTYATQAGDIVNVAVVVSGTSNVANLNGAVEHQ